MRRCIHPLWAVPPLLLFALIFSLHWYRNHPALSSLDLATRQKLATADMLSVWYQPPSTPTKYPSSILIHTFQRVKEPLPSLYKHIQTFGHNTNLEGAPRHGYIYLEWKWGTEKFPLFTHEVRLNLDTLKGMYYGAYFGPLHSNSVKDLLSTLLANPKIGPKLREAMKR